MSSRCNKVEEKPCQFCKETDCILSFDHKFSEIGERVFVDLRMDLEFNQLDIQFGVLEKGTRRPVCSEWSDAVDINYCPVCGKKLPKVKTFL